MGELDGRTYKAKKLVKDLVSNVHSLELNDVIKKDDSHVASIISEGTEFNGDFKSSKELHVFGTINGNVNCADKVYISGVVRGNIKASQVITTSGIINGNIDAEDIEIKECSVVSGDYIKAQTILIDGSVDSKIKAVEVVICSSAIVNGEIKYKSISIEDGATVKSNMFYGKYKTIDELDIDDSEVEETTKEEMEYSEAAKFSLGG